MNTLTINLTGTITLDRKSLENLIGNVTPQPAPTEPQKLLTGESSFIDENTMLKRLTVSRNTLFSWRKAGKIPAVKIGRRTLYHWPSVESALLRCQKGGYF